MKALKSLFLVFAMGIVTINLAAADTATKPIKRDLLQQLASAKSETEAREAEGKVWEFWFSQSPNADVRKLLDAGRERIQAYDFEAAENYLDEVIEAAPDYAEGYNQRAFARFLRENYAQSLADIEKTLALEPHHFGALAGMYHILRIQNRTAAAMGALRRAVTIHPWINERGALPKDMWPESYKQLHEPGLEI